MTTTIELARWWREPSPVLDPVASEKTMGKDHDSRGDPVYPPLSPFTETNGESVHPSIGEVAARYAAGDRDAFLQAYGGQSVPPMTFQPDRVRADDQRALHEDWSQHVVEIELGHLELSVETQVGQYFGARGEVEAWAMSIRAALVDTDDEVENSGTRETTSGKTSIGLKWTTSSSRMKGRSFTPEEEPLEARLFEYLLSQGESETTLEALIGRWESFGGRGTPSLPGRGAIDSALNRLRDELCDIGLDVPSVGTGWRLEGFRS